VDTSSYQRAANAVLEAISHESVIMYVDGLQVTAKKPEGPTPTSLASTLARVFGTVGTITVPGPPRLVNIRPVDYALIATKVPVRILIDMLNVGAKPSAVALLNAAKHVLSGTEPPRVLKLAIAVHCGVDDTRALRNHEWAQLLQMVDALDRRGFLTQTPHVLSHAAGCKDVGKSLPYSMYLSYLPRVWELATIQPLSFMGPVQKQYFVLARTESALLFLAGLVERDMQDDGSWDRDTSLLLRQVWRSVSTAMQVTIDTYQKDVWEWLMKLHIAMGRNTVRLHNFVIDRLGHVVQDPGVRKRVARKIFFPARETYTSSGAGLGGAGLGGAGGGGSVPSAFFMTIVEKEEGQQRALDKLKGVLEKVTPFLTTPQSRMWMYSPKVCAHFQRMAREEEEEEEEEVSG
jgi:hypothetical protein